MRTTRFGSLVGLGTLALMGWGADLGAQAPATAAPPPPPPSPHPSPVRRLAGASFVVARYKAGSSVSVYASSRLGAGMAVAGVVGKPNSTNWAFVAGAGTRIRFAPHAGMTVILGAATATNGTSLRLYLLPKLATGSVLLTATTGAYQPLAGDGRRQFAIDPLTVSVRLTDRIRAGLSTVLSLSEGRRATVGAGPTVQMAVPGGAVSLELVALSGSGHPQLRTSFQASH